MTQKLALRMIGGKGGNAMSEEKRMPVLTGRKKQIFYTGLVYLLVCFMTAGEKR